MLELKIKCKWLRFLSHFSLVFFVSFEIDRRHCFRFSFYIFAIEIIHREEKNGTARVFYCHIENDSALPKRKHLMAMGAERKENPKRNIFDDKVQGKNTTKQFHQLCTCSSVGTEKIRMNRKQRFFSPLSLSLSISLTKPQ